MQVHFSQYNAKLIANVRSYADGNVGIFIENQRGVQFVCTIEEAESFADNLATAARRGRDLVAGRKGAKHALGMDQDVALTAAEVAAD